MTEHIAHSGAWGIALIVIVVASWLLYRYLAPKTWKEWASAGVIQAFIIALYAEMYGFPLTIYLLVRFFGLDQTNLNASLWSTLLGMGEAGMMIAMIFGYILLFAGIGIFMEGWRELHRARKENRLITDRLYGLVRHPNTLGSSSRSSARALCIGRPFSPSLSSRHRARLLPAGAQRGAQSGGGIRRRIPRIPETRADVRPALGAMARDDLDAKRILQ